MKFLEGSLCKEEEMITKKIIDFSKTYRNEEFGITQLSEDEYEFYSKSGNYKGFINLGKNPELIFI